MKSALAWGRPKGYNQPSPKHQIMTLSINPPVLPSPLLTDTRHHMLEAGLREISQQCEAALTHFRHEVLHRLEQQLHQVGGLDERLDVGSESLRQAREQVQRHDHEVLVRGVHLLRVLLVRLETDMKRWLK